MSHLRGVWIIELAELASMRGQVSVEAVKLFLSRRTDRYRPSYGRREADFPRQCVFSASTNLAEYLTDATGNRRFWPVQCRGIDVSSITNDRDQLWAEAAHAYRNGEAWHLVDDDIRAAASIEQHKRMERDPWEDVVSDWIERQTPGSGLTSRELLDRALNLKPSDMDNAKLRRLGIVMRSLGYSPRTQKIGGRAVRSWVLPSY